MILAELLYGIARGLDYLLNYVLPALQAWIASPVGQVMIIITTAFVSLYWLWFLIDKLKRRAQRRAYRQPYKPLQPPKKTVRAEPPKKPVVHSSTRIPRSRSSAIAAKIDRLLHGDVEARNRLVQSAILKNPGMRDEWYYEKVLHDLHRDRR